MARLFTRVDFEALYYAGVPLTDGPLTISCWVYPVSSNIMYIIALGDASAASIWMRRLSAGELEWSLWGSGGLRSATTTNTMTTNAWNHLLGSTTAGGQSMRALINNAGLHAPSGTDLSLSLTNNFNIARSAAASSYWDGRIAEIVIWNAVLDPSEETALYRKVHPFNIRPNALVSYIPLWRAEDEDYIANYSFSLVSTPDVAEHPSLIYQVPRAYFLPAAPAADERAIKALFVRPDWSHQIAGLGV